MHGNGTLQDAGCRGRRVEHEAQVVAERPEGPTHRHQREASPATRARASARATRGAAAQRRRGAAPLTRGSTTYEGQHHLRGAAPLTRGDAGAEEEGGERGGPDDARVEQHLSRLLQLLCAAQACTRRVRLVREEGRDVSS